MNSNHATEVEAGMRFEFGNGLYRLVMPGSLKKNWLDRHKARLQT